MTKKKDLASQFILDGINGTLVERSAEDNERFEKWGDELQEHMRAEFEERRRYALKYLSEHPDIWTTQYK